MKLKLLFVITVVFQLSLHAQDLTAPVQSLWEETDKAIELNYINSDYCDYYILSSKDKEMRIRPGKTTLVRVPKERYNPKDPEFFPSSYRIYKGCFPQKLNPDLKYALPVKSGDSTFFVIDTRKSTMTYLFRTAILDTVYAVRGGVACKNNNMGLSTKGESIESVGDILICHYDQTMAHYGMLYQSFVKPGEEINVGQPVGIVSYKPYFSLSFFYLDPNKFQGASTVGMPHTYFNPIFHTTLGDTRLDEKKFYTSELSDSIITQEMTKGELKRYMKRKQKTAEKK